MKILTLTERELYELLKEYEIARQVITDDPAKWFSQREFRNIKDEDEVIIKELDENDAFIDGDFDTLFDGSIIYKHIS